MPAPKPPKAHLSDGEIKEKLRLAKDKLEQRRWNAIWISQTQSLAHHKIAAMLAVSVQAVKAWIGAYNRKGPDALSSNLSARGAKPFLSREAELKVLTELREKAVAGKLVTARLLGQKLQEELGCPVSSSYSYRVMKRHDWRKVVPRPVHPKADKEAQEDFKKNSAKSSWEPPPISPVEKGPPR